MRGTPSWAKLLLYRRAGAPFWALVHVCPLSPAMPAGHKFAVKFSGDGGGGGSSRHLQADSRQQEQQPQQQQGTEGAAGGSSSAREDTDTATAGAGRISEVASGGDDSTADGDAGVSSSSNISISDNAGGAPAAAAATGGGVGGFLQLLVFADITSSRLKRLGKYVVGKVVGQGASGIVRMGKNPATGEGASSTLGIDLACWRLHGGVGKLCDQSRA